MDTGGIQRFERLFSQAGRVYLSQVDLSVSDRFVVGQLVNELDQWSVHRREVDRQLRQFAKSASVTEREARAVLESIPCVGPVTIDVVLSELGDIRRFRSCKQVVAYAGLAPGIRSSAGRTKQQGINREGSRRLRWAMVELAWRIVTKTRRWGLIYENLKRRMGSKKAVVAVARRLLVVIATLLRSGQKYCQAADVLAPTLT